MRERLDALESLLILLLIVQQLSVFVVLFRMTSWRMNTNVFWSDRYTSSKPQRVAHTEQRRWVATRTVGAPRGMDSERTKYEENEQWQIQ
jgi:hypothetical protein